MGAGEVAPRADGACISCFGERDVGVDAFPIRLIDIPRQADLPLSGTGIPKTGAADDDPPTTRRPETDPAASERCAVKAP